MCSAIIVGLDSVRGGFFGMSFLEGGGCLRIDRRLATGLVLLVDALDGDLGGAGAGLDCVLACFELELPDPFDNQSSNPPETGLFRFFSVFLLW